MWGGGGAILSGDEGVAAAVGQGDHLADGEVGSGRAAFEGGETFGGEGRGARMAAGPRVVRSTRIVVFGGRGLPFVTVRGRGDSFRSVVIAP